eukprot:15444070-Alexandrium_andersonii.AAC.1
MPRAVASCPRLHVICGLVVQPWLCRDVHPLGGEPVGRDFPLGGFIQRDLTLAHFGFRAVAGVRPARRVDSLLLKRESGRPQEGSLPLARPELLRRERGE